MMENKDWNTCIPNMKICVPCRISAACTTYQILIWPAVWEDTSEGSEWKEDVKTEKLFPFPYLLPANLNSSDCSFGSSLLFFGSGL